MATDTQQAAPGPEENRGTDTLRGYVSRDMVASTLFAMRLCTIMSTFLFLLCSFGLLGELGYQGYFNAMLTSFFTFSIRLYQRKQERQIYTFSKEMFVLLSTEDSGHYMLYTFFYYSQAPLSIYLIPPFFYAILFSVSYTNGLAPFLPVYIQNLLVKLNGRIARGQVELRRFIAYTEISLLLVVIWNALTGYMFFLAPLVHYKFVSLRYQSVRNNSVALSFSELRLGVEFLSRHPRCPPAVSNILIRGVAFVSGLAPTRQMRREA